MTISVNKDFTTTGIQAAVDVGAPKVLSYSMESANGDATVNVEVKLTPDGSWKVETAGIAEATVLTTVGPVIGIRLNISSQGTGATVTFEVVGISR